MNRLVRPVSFAFEPDVVFQFAKIGFGSTGAPTIDTNQSKGICGFARSTVVSVGTTTSSSASVTGVVATSGIYNGMSVTGSGIQAGTTVSSVNPGAGTLTLSQTATASASPTLTFSKGQYTMTFGSQLSPARFDAYVKLLGISHQFDVSGVSAGSSPAAPVAPVMFLVTNNISSSTLANLVIQFGTLAGSLFTAVDPASGEIVRIATKLCRSTAI